MVFENGPRKVDVSICIRQYIGKSQSTILALKKRDLSDNIEAFEIPVGIHHWITHTKMNLSIDQFSHDES